MSNAACLCRAFYAGDPWVFIYDLHAKQSKRDRERSQQEVAATQATTAHEAAARAKAEAELAVKLKAEEELMRRLEAASQEREELARAIHEKIAEVGAEASARQKVCARMLRCHVVLLHLTIGDSLWCA